MNTPIICPDQRRPCPTPDKCRTDCHFNTAELSEHPAYGYAAGTDALPGDDPMLLRAEGCQRLCWLVCCIGLGILFAAACLAVLWHFDAPLRDAAASVRQAVESAITLHTKFFWAWASINF